jgi:hypothetical protein
MMQKSNKLNAYLFLFLYRHGEYSCGFLHVTKIIYIELRIYDAVQ